MKSTEVKKLPSPVHVAHESTASTVGSELSDLQAQHHKLLDSLTALAKRLDPVLADKARAVIMEARATELVCCSLAVSIHAEVETVIKANAIVTDLLACLDL